MAITARGVHAAACALIHQATAALGAEPPTVAFFADEFPESLSLAPGLAVEGRQGRLAVSFATEDSRIGRLAAKRNYKISYEYPVSDRVSVGLIGQLRAASDRSEAPRDYRFQIQGRLRF